MKFTELKISGVFKIDPIMFSDKRGDFYEWFKAEEFSKEIGVEFNLKQANCSISALGTIRGIHFALPPLGQQKYVACFNGSVTDVVVDLRPKSATFGQWEMIELTEENHSVIFIPNGIGHGFAATTDKSFLTYLCDQPYSPNTEMSINPFDTDLAIKWPAFSEQLVSPRDLSAPNFAESIDTLTSAFKDLAAN